jgi:hypothetical protein
LGTRCSGEIVPKLVATDAWHQGARRAPNSLYLAWVLSPDMRHLRYGRRAWRVVDMIDSSLHCPVAGAHDGIDCPGRRRARERVEAAVLGTMEAG